MKAGNAMKRIRKVSTEQAVSGHTAVRKVNVERTGVDQYATSAKVTLYVDGVIAAIIYGDSAATFKDKAFVYDNEGSIIGTVEFDEMVTSLNGERTILVTPDTEVYEA